MKVAWTVLIISALTDMGISVGTALSAAMVTSGKAEMPSHAVLLLASVGGLVAFMRTIQQALKVTPETAAALKGQDKP